jgi:hypothetical protein
MKKNRIRLIASLAAFLLMAGFSMYGIKTSAGRILMNGDLQAKHAFMGSNCLKCHAPLKGVDSSACEACHADKRHFNGAKEPVVTAASQDCFDCHAEHRGKEFSAACVDSRNCRACHASGLHQADKGAGGVPEGERGIRFPHEMHSSIGVVSAEQCASCHDVSRPGAGSLAIKFDGSCNSCHPIEKHGFDSPDMDQCARCHANGVFGPTPRAEAKGFSFAHARHNSVNCAECHRGLLDVSANAASKARPSAMDCLGCHAATGVSDDAACVTCHGYH